MSDDNAYSLARTLLLIKVFTDEMNRRRKTDLAPIASDLMPAGTRLPVLIEGKQAGWVSMPKPSTRASVTDEKKLQAFVEERFPSEIETVKRVRPKFVELLKTAAKDHDGWLNADSGEVIPIPGIAVETGESSPRTEAADGAFQIIADALAEGTLTEVRQILALPMAGGEDQ
jgi:hypothetical protein